MPPPKNPYRDNVYGALKSKVAGFSLSPEEFEKRISTDDNYRKNVYKALKLKVEGFNVSEDDFNTRLGSKKKESTGSVAALPGPETSGPGQPAPVEPQQPPISSFDPGQSVGPPAPGEPPAPKELDPRATLMKTAWNTMRYQIPADLIGASLAMEKAPQDLNKAVFEPGMQAVGLDIQKGETNTETPGWMDRLMGYFTHKPSQAEKIAQEKRKSEEAPRVKQRKQMLLTALELREQGQKANEGLVNSLDKAEDWLDYVNWAASALGQAGAQIPMAVATGGGTAFGQEIGTIYLDGVKELALEKGMTPEQLIASGKDESLYPMVFGMGAGALEFVGAKGVMGSFNKQEVMKSVRERALSVLKAGGGESLTEGGQSILEQIGVRKVAGKTWEETFKSIDPKDIKESMAQGLVGGSGIHAVGVASQAKDPQAKAPENVVQPPQGDLGKPQPQPPAAPPPPPPPAPAPAAPPAPTPTPAKAQPPRPAEEPKPEEKTEAPATGEIKVNPKEENFVTRGGASVGQRVDVPGLEDMDLAVVRDPQSPMQYMVIDIRTGQGIVGTTESTPEDAVRSTLDKLTEKGATQERLLDALEGKETKNPSPKTDKFYRDRIEKKKAEQEKAPFKYSEEDRKLMAELSERMKKLPKEWSDMPLSFFEKYQTQKQLPGDIGSMMTRERMIKMAEDAEKNAKVAEYFDRGEPIPAELKKGGYDILPDKVQIGSRQSYYGNEKFEPVDASTILGTGGVRDVAPKFFERSGIDRKEFEEVINTARQINNFYGYQKIKIESGIFTGLAIRKKENVDQKEIDLNLKTYRDLKDAVMKLYPTIKPQGNAVQKQSTSSVLQHPQKGVGEKGSERGGVESVKQGKEVAKESSPETKSPVQKSEKITAESVANKVESMQELTPDEQKFYDKNRREVDKLVSPPAEEKPEVEPEPERPKIDNSKKPYRYRILDSDGRLVGTGGNSWFTLEQAKEKVKPGQSIYEYDLNTMDRLWEVMAGPKEGKKSEPIEADYSKWKRKNVVYRGLKEHGKAENNRSGMLGKGLYTAPSSNKSMTKEYGDKYFVVNARPKNPKVFNSINEWEIWFQNQLVLPFSKAKGKEFPDIRDFESQTSIEKELQKQGYDGIEIKGREMVNFAPPDNVKYFKSEDEVKAYHNSLLENEETEIQESMAMPPDDTLNESDNESIAQAWDSVKKLPRDAEYKVGDKVVNPFYDQETGGVGEPARQGTVVETKKDKFSIKWSDGEVEESYTGRTNYATQRAWDKMDELGLSMAEKRAMMAASSYLKPWKNDQIVDNGGYPQDVIDAYKRISKVMTEKAPKTESPKESPKPITKESFTADKSNQEWQDRLKGQQPITTGKTPYVVQEGMMDPKKMSKTELASELSKGRLPFAHYMELTKGELVSLYEKHGIKTPEKVPLDKFNRGVKVRSVSSGKVYTVGKNTAGNIELTDEDGLKTTWAAKSTQFQKYTREKSEETKQAEQIKAEEAKEKQDLLTSHPVSVRAAVLQYFASKGRVNTKDFIRETGFGSERKTNTVQGKRGLEEFRKRIWAIASEAPTIDQLVGKIKATMGGIDEVTVDEGDIRNEIISVLMDHSTPTSIYRELKDTQNAEPQMSEEEYEQQWIEEQNRRYEEEQQYLSDQEAAQVIDEKVEDTLVTKEIKKQLEAAQVELQAAETSFKEKAKELDRTLMADQENLFGERKSDGGLFGDQRAKPEARNEILKTFRVRIDKAKAEIDRLNAKLEAERGKRDITLFDEQMDDRPGNAFEELLSSGEFTAENIDKLRDELFSGFPFTPRDFELVKSYLQEHGNRESTEGIPEAGKPGTQGESSRSAEIGVSPESIERKIRSLRDATDPEQKRKIAESILADTGHYLLNRQGILTGTDGSFADSTSDTFFDLMDESRTVYLLDEDAKIAESEKDFKAISEKLGAELPLVDGKLVFDDAFGNEVMNAARELGYDGVRLMEIDGTNSTIQILNFDKLTHVTGEDFVSARQTNKNRVSFDRSGTTVYGTIEAQRGDGKIFVRDHNGNVYILDKGEVTETGERKTREKPGTLTRVPEHLDSNEDILQYNSKRSKPIGIIGGPKFMFATDLGPLFDKAGKLAKEYFHSRGHMPHNVFERWVSAKGEISRYEYEIKTTIQDFEKSVREEYGKNGMSDSEVNDINLALQGKAPRKAIPPKTLANVQVMRAQIDNLTRRFINEGVIAGNAVLQFNPVTKASRAERDAAKLIIKAAKKDYGNSLTQADVMNINLAIQGKPTLAPLEPNTLQAINKVRQALPNTTMQFEDGSLYAKFIANLGAYITRSYRKHDDPLWSEFVPEQVKNKAMALLRGRYPGKSPEQIDGLIKYLTQSQEAPMAILKGSKLGSMDLSVLKKRGEIAPEIRALMGEYSDPLVNYARSVTKMASLIAKHHFLQDVRRMGMNKFLFEESVGDFTVELAADKSKVMEPLNGLFTTPEIAKAFEEFNSTPAMSEGLKMYMKVNGYIKAGKTVFSIMTHFRNLLGNIGFLIMNGHWDLSKIGQARQVAWANIYSSDQVIRDKFKRYIELGIVKDSSAGGELRQYLEDIRKGNDFFQKINDGKLVRMKNAVLETAQNLYQFEDDIFKIYAFENEIARYKKAYPNKSQKWVEKKAATIVRDTYPTYSMVPKIVKGFRANPFTGTFVNFPAEVLRTTYNSISLGLAEMKSKETAGIGATRLSGAMLALLVPTISSLVSRAWNGMDGDDDDDLRKFMAPWQKNSEFVYLDQKGHTVTIIDMGYSDPHNYIKKPFYALMNGESVVGSAFFFSVELLKPFLSEEMVYAAIVDVTRNAKANGDKVYDPNSAPGTIAADIYNHVESIVQIGTIKNIQRIGKAAQGKTDKYGNKYDLLTEVGSTITGQRTEKKDIRQALVFKVYQIRDDIALTNKRLRRVMKNNESSDKEKQIAQADHDVAMNNILNDAHGIYLSAIRLGVNPREALALMRETRSRELMVKITGDKNAKIDE